ncbi:hypothetical protein M0804_008347 [Polistes exclamans]|nr:hypothetical protein M0804_008347 [Polistes exclamans]
MFESGGGTAHGTRPARDHVEQQATNQPLPMASLPRRGSSPYNNDDDDDDDDDDEKYEREKERERENHPFRAPSPESRLLDSY